LTKALACVLKARAELTLSTLTALHPDLRSAFRLVSGLVFFKTILCSFPFKTILASAKSELMAIFRLQLLRTSNQHLSIFIDRSNRAQLNQY
jgi:hypothetical protein